MSRLSFGDCVLDLAERRLWRSGHEVHLAPKALDLLALLIGQRPRALPKDDILRHVWPDAFVSDNTLAALVRDLRRALGDDPHEPRYVRTVHAFGYAFAAPIDDAPGAEVPSRWSVLHDGRTLLPREGVNVLGRGGPDVVPIESPTVSRRHARVVVTGTHATCEDLGSRNGTWRGVTPVDAVVDLRDGDELRLGSVVLRVCCRREARTTHHLSPSG